MAVGQKITYGEVFQRFRKLNPHLVRYIRDYRPAGIMCIRVYLATNTYIDALYNEDNDKFEIVRVDITI